MASFTNQLCRAPSNSSLRRLPGELRVMIFQEAFKGPDADYALVSALEDDPVLWEEAAQVYYRQNAVVIDRTSDGSKSALQQMLARNPDVAHFFKHLVIKFSTEETVKHSIGLYRGQIQDRVRGHRNWHTHVRSVNQSTYPAMSSVYRFLPHRAPSSSTGSNPANFDLANIETAVLDFADFLPEKYHVIESSVQGLISRSKQSLTQLFIRVRSDDWSNATHLTADKRREAGKVIDNINKAMGVTGRLLTVASRQQVHDYEHFSPRAHMLAPALVYFWNKQDSNKSYKPVDEQWVSDYLTPLEDLANKNQSELVNSAKCRSKCGLGFCNSRYSSVCDKERCGWTCAKESSMAELGIVEHFLEDRNFDWNDPALIVDESVFKARRLAQYNKERSKQPPTL